MSRLHAIELHLLMLAGIAFLCVSGWQVRRTGKVLFEAENTIKAANSLVPTARATLTKLNAEIDEAHRLTLEAGLTAMEARKASKLELAYLPQWNRQITSTMENMNQAVTALQGTAHAASETLHGASLDLSALNDSIQATKPLITDSDATMRQFQAALPALQKTASNVEKMTANGARLTQDAADEADELVHPNKKKLGFWGGFWVGCQYVHKMMPSIF